MEYLKLWTTEGTRQEKIKMKILFQPQHIFILDVQPRQRATSFLFIFKLDFIIFFCYNVLPIFLLLYSYLLAMFALQYEHGDGLMLI